MLCGLPFDTLLFTLLLFHTLYLLLFHDVWITCALLLTAHVWILRALLLALHVLCCWFVLWCLLPGGALLFTFLFLLINLLLLIDALLLNNQPSTCFSYNQLTLLLQSVSVIVVVVVGFSPKLGFFDWDGKSSHHHENGNVLNRNSMSINLFNIKL